MSYFTEQFMYQHKAQNK